MMDIEKILNKKKEDLKMLESFFYYPSEIRITNQKKKTETDLVFLSGALGYTNYSNLKNNNDAIKTRNSTNIESVRESVNSENGEKSETEEEDMGLGLFD